MLSLTGAAYGLALFLTALTDCIYNTMLCSVLTHPKMEYPQIHPEMSLCGFLRGFFFSFLLSEIKVAGYKLCLKGTWFGFDFPNHCNCFI